jgi:predicted CoA-binding protein
MKYKPEDENIGEKELKTLVFGASMNEARASNRAIHRLESIGIETVAIGGREGMVSRTPISKGYPNLTGIHTITMYMGEKRQEEHIDYLLSLQPKRIIFNPGAENHALFITAKKLGIETINACTLVMLATGQY